MTEIALYLTEYAEITLTWHSAHVLIGGLICFILGFYVYVREKGSPIGSSYLLLMISLAVYFISAGIVYSSDDEAAGLAWSHIAHLGVLFIPYTLFSVGSALIGDTLNLRRWKAALLSISLLFMLTLLFTDSFLAGMRRLYWGYYVVYGSMGYLFLIYFVLTVAGVLIFFMLECRVAGDPLRRRRLRLSCLALIIGLLACVDFLPAIGIEIFSFGGIPIAFFAVMMSYTILRYRLVDITPELAAVPVIQSMRGAVIVTDRSGIIRLANNSAHRMIGIATPGLMNERAAQAVPWIRNMRSCEECPVGGSGEEVDWRDAEDGLHTVLVKVSVLRDVARNLVGWVYVAHDITDRKRAEYALQQMALHDSLTGLPNRKYFLDHLERMIELARRGETGFAILYMDLNKFKEINDDQGHEAGDRVLQVCAQRILSAVRRSDTVARIGGDEFVVLCSYLGSRDDAAVIASKISGYLEDPIQFKGGELSTGAAIGIARFPENGTEARALISAADQAMYRAKSGRKGWEFAGE